jgi:prephenate dehydratase
MKVAFLGPEGTYSHAALLADERAAGWEAIPAPTVFDAVLAVEDGVVDRALVPIENSTEGAVGPTMDALAVETADVRIVGEVVYPIRHALIARQEIDLDEVDAVLSHPQANAQCARFVRSAMPNAAVMSVPSTAEAVRMVVADEEAKAVALGPALAAEIYGGIVLRDGVEDESSNVTRFVWVAPVGTEPMGAATKTSVVWWGAGDESAGWLVGCLDEFASRDVNLTRIESRPRRLGLGHYMFFADLDGGASPGDDGPVTAAILAIAGHAETIRVLGSYPAAT